MAELKVIFKPIEDITPYENNPRINDSAVDYVANSIREFGWQQPIVVDMDKVIIAGHTRYKAAKQLGLDYVPVIVADKLSPQQVKAYRLADNKVAEIASWDYSMLDKELSGILDIEMDDFWFLASGNEEDYTKQIVGDDSGEIDLSDFSDDKFEHTCPRCGFVFSDREN